MNIRFFVNSAISSFKVFFFFYGDDKFITAQFSKFCFFWNSSLKDASHYFCGQDTCVVCHLTNSSLLEERIKEIIR